MLFDWTLSNDAGLLIESSAAGRGGTLRNSLCDSHCAAYGRVRRTIIGYLSAIYNNF